MSRPKTITITPVAVDADSIAESQTPGGAGNLTLTSSTVTFSQPAHVTVTSADDEQARTFTFTGTDRQGIAITEDIVGGDTATVTGTKNFATVTQIAVDDATAGAVTAGNGAALESQWIPANRFADDRNIQVVLSSGASLTWALQHTNSNIQANGFQEDDADAQVDPTYTSKTASLMCPLETIHRATRLAISGFSSGTATMHILED